MGFSTFEQKLIVLTSIIYTHVIKKNGNLLINYFEGIKTLI